MTERPAAEDNDRFLADFEAGRLPPESWPHEAHVRLAWIVLRLQPVSVAIERVRADEDWPSFRAANRDLLDFRQPVTSCHYSAAVLNSEAARRGFVEPDLRPLP